MINSYLNITLISQKPSSKVYLPTSEYKQRLLLIYSTIQFHNISTFKIQLTKRMSNIVTHKDLSFKLLYNRQTIEQIIRDLAKQINEYYQSLHEQKLELVVVCVLKGAFMFYSDLVKQIKFHHHSEFIRCKSYKGLESGKMTIETQLKPEIFQNKYVLVVEDIHDSGNTLKELISILGQFKPKRIDTVVLVKRPDKPVQIDLKFCGLVCGDFIIGYGLDYDEFGRHLPEIYEKI